VHDAAAPTLARRAAIFTGLAAAAVVAVLAVLFIPWQWVPGGQLTPMPESQFFTARQLARVDAYNRLRRELGWSAYFLSLAVSVALGLTPAGARLLRRVAGRFRWWLAVPLGVVVLLVIGRAVMLPFDLALRAQDLRYGLTRQSLGGWFLDWGIALVVAVVVTSVVLVLMVGLARWRPRTWFVGASAAAFLLVVAGSFVYPVVIQPLFNTFKPLPAGPLRSAVFRLADREGVHIDDVLVSNASKQTTTINAYVSGFGSTRRVVVYDNLQADLTPAQQRAVIAHELGHAKNNDVLHGTLIGAAGGVFGVSVLALVLDTAWLRRRSGTTGPTDPAVVAAVLALAALGTFAADPLVNVGSRAIEARADRVSLQTTNAAAPFIQMQRRLAWEALQDPEPPALSQLWWGTHPTPVQRAGLPASLKAAGDLP